MQIKVDINVNTIDGFNDVCGVPCSNEDVLNWDRIKICLKCKNPEVY